MGVAKMGAPEGHAEVCTSAQVAAVLQPAMAASPESSQCRAQVTKSQGRVRFCSGLVVFCAWDCIDVRRWCRATTSFGVGVAPSLSDETDVGTPRTCDAALGGQIKKK